MRTLRSIVLTLLPFLVVLVLVPYYLLTRHIYIYHFHLGPVRWIGALLFALGAAGYFWSAWDFVVRGRGAISQVYTPTALVITGPYRFSRNPAYVSYLLAFLGEGVFFGSVAILLLGALFHLRNTLFVHVHEERQLRKKFGAEYESYCRQVPRWLSRIPRKDPGHAV